jgi:hypothetical protein
MNRFGGLFLLVGFCLAILVPVRGVGDYQACPACKNPDAPTGPQEIGVASPGKFKLGITPPLDLASPHNDTTNNHDLKPDDVNKMKEMTTCKRQHRAKKNADIMDAYGSKVLVFCQKAFNNMRYKISSQEKYFCKSEKCEVRHVESGREIRGNCNHTGAHVNDAQSLSEVEIEYELNIVEPSEGIDGKVKVVCEIKEEPCPCYFPSPKDKDSEPLLLESTVSD